MNAPHPRDFKDYRSFLIELMAFEKTKRNGLNQSKLGQILGFKSRSHVTNLLKGKRQLTVIAAQKARKLFGSDEEAHLAFVELVMREINLSGHKTDRQAIKQVKARAAYRSEKQLVEAIFSEWYHLPILVLPMYAEFELSVPWIKSKIIGPITDEQINATMDLGFKLGIWQKNAQGKIEADLSSGFSRRNMDPEKNREYVEKMWKLESRIEPARRRRQFNSLHLTPNQVDEFERDLMDAVIDVLTRYQGWEMPLPPRAQRYGIASSLWPITEVIAEGATVRVRGKSKTKKKR
jgi:uncharacterized protein (TIGR02147 family)